MYTEIVLLVDASSSMSDSKSKTVSALKEFIAGQKLVPGKCNLSVISFTGGNPGWNALVTKEVSQPIRRVLVDGDIQKVSLNENDYVPGGWTPLYDATCETIDELGAKLARMPEVVRPNKVLIVILTDGEENRSVKFDLKDVKSKIQHQENVYNWNFVFLGADFNSHTIRESTGLDASRSYNYAKSDSSIAWRGINKTVESYRMSGNNKMYNFAAEVEANVAKEANV